MVFPIYNPTGTYQIIKGKTIKNINNFHNKKIDKLNSINKIIDRLIEEYKEKEVFIIGYSPNWKNKVNMSRKNRRDKIS